MLRLREALLLPLAAATLAGPSRADSEPIAREPHPEPRVIVNVRSVSGPHARTEVERAARLGWGRIVSCYKASEKRPRGAIELELVVSAGGKVSSSRRTKSTLGDKPLARCVTKAMKRVAMPQARRRSIARVEIKLAPGDS